ncbi:C4-dicarboxylate ABC transporter [Helicobacter monodelphidis]|uniref:anaerobic C4-dicarboxylate transporter n=1 Tax=Helicobacter sp. 15-1451 TaxID=2004995 RepID=UPI000DCC67AF|nr:anaerobic C4-dicarboxylate transporter [Helicobacter sp. 15-1451]RAX58651.1 C4-dicarboxylate ABC transporter [Helicobacter sp. 15-1451]
MELALELIVLFGAIFLGVRLGGMAIGYAGGIGVILLSLGLGLKPGAIPWDVILIIMSVIAAITAMQVAGGLDYMVQVAEKVLRKNPKQINYLAPTVTYLLTFLAGTGHTAFSMIPVIVEVAKEQNIKPSVPLSIAVVSSQIAITASPVSAAVVWMSGELEKYGWSYPMLLLVWAITTYCGCMITAFIVSKFSNLDLSSDPVYQERLKAGLIRQVEGGIHQVSLPKSAKTSVMIFLAGVVLVVFYATSISNVVRIPMLNFVNDFVPVYMDKELESARLKILDKVPLGNEQGIEIVKAVDTQIASAKQKFYAADFKNDSSQIDAYQDVLKETKANLLPILSENAEASKVMETSLDYLITNSNQFLTDYVQKDGIIGSLFAIVKSYIDPVRLPRDGAIMSFMLAIATLIVIFCKVDTTKLLDTGTFKAGMTACVCVLGVAWLGNTFVGAHEKEIGLLAGKMVQQYPWLLAVALFFASMLLYSQAATAKAIMPTVIGALGITALNPGDSYILVASFAAVSALFVLPTYPTLLGAVQMDDTGSTRIGKYIFNHAFIVPGVLAIAITVALGFVIVPFLA